jgi:hypothetical protein
VSTLKRREFSAWHQFKEDADTIHAIALGKIGKDGNDGEHAQAERLLLARLVSEECAEQIAAVWLSVGKYRQKKSDCGQRLIKSLLDAYTRSQNLPLIEGDYQRSIERLKELEGYIDELEAYFASGAEQAGKGDSIARDPTFKIFAKDRSPNPHDFIGWRACLSRIKGFLSDRIDDFSNAFDELKLSRKNNSAISTRIAFTTAISDAMRNIFGRPLDDVVRALTDVVFGAQVEITVDQIKEARKSAAKRRKTADGDDLLKLMRRLNIPITRENYLHLAYTDEPPKQLSAEQEACPQPELRKPTTPSQLAEKGSQSTRVAGTAKTKIKRNKSRR